MASRSRILDDAEDLALTWVEQELGRYSFPKNWKAVKASGLARSRIQGWLQAANVEGDPDEIIRAIDRLAANYAGKWS